MDPQEYYPNGVPRPQLANKERQQNIINCAQKCINSNKYKKSGRKNCLYKCTIPSVDKTIKYKKTRKNKSRKSRKSKKSYKR